MAPVKKRRIDDYFRATKKRRREHTLPRRRQPPTSRWNRTRRWLSAAAGGTLGFIAGNTKGAYEGARLGYRAAVSTEGSGEQPRTLVEPGETRRMTHNTHDFAGYSSVRLGRPRKSRLPKGLKDMLGPRRIASTLAANLASTDSRRDLWQDLPLVLDGTAAPGNIRYAVHAQPDIASYLSTTEIDSTTTGPARTRRFLVENHKMKITFKNMTTAPIEIEIYHITNRRDMQIASSGGTLLTPTRSFEQGISESQSTLANQITALGAGTLQSASVAAGMLPTMSERFTHWFRIIKKTRVMIGGGQQHICFGKLYSNHLINMAFATEMSFYRNRTYWCMVRVIGTQVQDSTQAGFYGLSQKSIQVMVEHVAQVRQLEKQRGITTLYNNLADILPANQEHVNEDTDAVALVTIA